MWSDVLAPVLILLSIFGGVWGIIFISGRSKVAVLREKRLLAEAQAQAGQQATQAPLRPPADPNAAPVLALRLPEPYRSQVLGLLAKLQDIPATLDARGQYLLRQTQAEYLPETLQAYLSLPEGARAQLAAQGMSAETLLAEQLQLIAEAVADALRQDHAAADRLLTQGRFLRERFEVQKLEPLTPLPMPEKEPAPR